MAQTTEITTLYKALLGRAPDANALQANAEHDLVTVAQRIVGSQEFRQRYNATAAASLRPQGLPNLRPLPDERLVYLHIPKCGGTTLHHLMTQWYGAENFHPERYNQLYLYSAADLVGYQVFSGHFDFYATRLIPGRKRMISFLRDPLQRLMSLYHFHRAHRSELIERQNLTLVRWATEMDIDAYFADERVRSHPAVHNSITRHFSNVPQIAHLWKGRPDPRLERLELIYDQASKNLQRFDFIGFMDDYDGSVARLAKRLGKPGVEQIERKQSLDSLMQENPGMRRIEKQTPSAATLAQMEDLITYDRRLYDKARQIFAPPES